METTSLLWMGYTLQHLSIDVIHFLGGWYAPQTEQSDWTV